MSVPYTKQLTYIESTGTQYIDTGIVPTSTTRIELKYQYSTGNYTSGCGVCANGASKRFHINTYLGKLHFGSGGSSNWVNTIDQNTNIHSASLSGSGNVLIDGNIYSTKGTVDDFTGYNIYLFRVNGESSYTNGYRVYYCKIYDNDILVRNFIPVRIGNEGYLYDVISGELFGNNGSGNFVLGDDITFYSGFLPFRRRLLYAKPNLNIEHEIEFVRPIYNTAFDTNIIPTMSTHIIICGRYANLSNTDFVGTFYPTNQRYHIGCWKNKFYFGCGSKYLQIIAWDTNIHTFELYGNGTGVLDDTEYSIGAALGVAQTTISLFSRHDNDTAGYSYSTSFALYSAKIYEGETLVKDYVPCRYRGGIYLKDKVSGELEFVGYEENFEIGNDVN